MRAHKHAYTRSPKHTLSRTTPHARDTMWNVATSWPIIPISCWCPSKRCNCRDNRKIWCLR